MYKNKAIHPIDRMLSVLLDGNKNEIWALAEDPKSWFGHRTQVFSEDLSSSKPCTWNKFKNKQKNNNPESFIGTFKS